MNWVMLVAASAVVGAVAGASVQLLLPGATVGSWTAGVVPGLILGLLGGLLIAGVGHHYRRRGSGRRRVLRPVRVVAAPAAAVALVVMLAATTNPQIATLARLMVCLGIAAAYGAITHLVLRVGL